jgi:hypothetical protein
VEKSLMLSEKLFCLAVNPKNGGFLLVASSTLGITITAAVFVELMNKNLISIRNSFVHIDNSNVQIDGIHEFFMNRIRLRNKERKLRNWISYFNVRSRKIQKLFIRRLVLKNILRTEEKRILFIPYEKVYLTDSDWIAAVRNEIATVALGKGTLSDDSVILAILVWRMNLLSRIFPERSVRKEAVRFLKKLPEDDVSKAVREAIQMMHAAVFIVAS